MFRIAIFADALAVFARTVLIDFEEAHAVASSCGH
jgi:hypothetical protein